MVKDISSRSSKFIEVTVFLLVLLWIYTAASKILAFDAYRLQMYNQAVPNWVAFILIWSLPPVEIMTAILLSFPTTRSWGLLSSVLLMTVFTLYVGLATFHVFEQVPCSCGGVLKNMSWPAHLLFNLFFLLLSFLAITLHNRERRLIGTV